MDGNDLVDIVVGSDVHQSQILLNLGENVFEETAIPRDYTLAKMKEEYFEFLVR
jgi:hypothetical protein